MTACALDLKALHPAQLEIESTAQKYNVLDAGRRFGKNEFLVSRVIDGSPQRRNGLLSGLSWGWFAPTYKILDDSWRLLVETLSPIPGIYINQSKYYAKLPTGGVVECWSFEAGDDVGRSREYSGGIVVDEAAMVPRLLHIRTKSLSALTVKFEHAEEWYASTPKGMGNDFYPLYRYGQDGENGWASWQYPTWANPHIPRSFIEEKRRTMPESDFDQEYGAQFLDSEAHPIGLEHIRACLSPLSQAEPAVWGIDLARAVDFTVAIGLDAGGHVCQLERWKAPWGVTRERIKAIVGREAIAYIDSTGVGDPIVEDLQRDGIKCVASIFTARSKQQWVEGLIAGIQQHRVHFPAGWLQGELEALTAERTATGTRYTAPEGLHDDGVMALSLGWFGYSQVVHPESQMPKTREYREGEAMPYDYKARRQVPRPSAEEELDKMFGRTGSRTLAGRHALPRR